MEHEYKLMGMAPFASHSSQARAIADSFHELFECHSDGLIYQRTHACPRIQALGPWLLERYRFERFDNIAAGLQIFIEEFAVEWIRRLLTTLGVRKLAVAGGLFMNVKLNQIIAELDLVDDLFVFPSCGDESNVFGAAYSYYAESAGNIPEPLQNYYLGSSFDDSQILATLESFEFLKSGVRWHRSDDIEETVSELLSKGQIVARFSGREEFGARALGNRSILAPAGDPRAVQTINHMIKKRDFWMPFAPSCISPRDYVHNPKGLVSPYMMLTFTTDPRKRQQLVATIQEMDKTARVQHVLQEQNASYYRLIDAYRKKSGESVILNTSFNLHGYPIVHAPQDALSVFDQSGICYLALGSYLVEAPVTETQ
jgi:carbamoyltransferase